MLVSQLRHVKEAVQPLQGGGRGPDGDNSPRTVHDERSADTSPRAEKRKTRVEKKVKNQKGRRKKGDAPVAETLEEHDNRLKVCMRRSRNESRLKEVIGPSQTLLAGDVAHQ